MSDASPATPSMPSSGRLIFTLALISMISGFLIVLIYQATLEPIARNRREALERAVFSVLPGAVARANFQLNEEGMERLPDDAIARANMFAGYDAEGNLVGFALEGSSRGYADVVRVLYGYSLDRECIVGFTVLQSSETPGLGDKIAKDPVFLANFEALAVPLNEERTALRNEVETVKHGAKTQPWQIDGITGATVSSMTVGRALRESTRRMLPLIAAHETDLRAKKEAGN
jgi:electron transport complex protein RnfG